MLRIWNGTWRIIGAAEMELGWNLEWIVGID